MYTPMPFSKEAPTSNFHQCKLNSFSLKTKFTKKTMLTQFIFTSATIPESNLMFIRKIQSVKNMRNEAEHPNSHHTKENFALLFHGLYFPGSWYCKLCRNPKIHHEILNSSCRYEDCWAIIHQNTATSHEVWFFPQNRWIPDNPNPNDPPLVRRAQTLAPQILPTTLKVPPRSPLISTAKQLAFPSKQLKQAIP